ncbi:MAG: FAD-dependent oxidoreductase [Actinomycetota bacterium]|nr:FAD-dependent oxidoreductase [Actinomycetota bacterium]
MAYPVAAVDQVIVVGGGIGGLATAYTLARSGLQVRVLERAAEFAEIGAGLQLAPNATRLLSRFDLLDDVLATAVLPRRIVARNALSGEELTSLDLTAAAERYGGPYIVLHRSDLLDVLVARCRAESRVTLETSKRVVRAADHGDAVEVVCDDRTTYQAAVLVGADGLNSSIRSMVVQDEPICSGYVAYRGAVPLDTVHRRPPLEDVVVWFGPGLHLVQYPVRSATLYNQVAVFRSDAFAAGAQDWGTPAELDARFSACSAPVREALTALRRDRRWPLYDRLPAGTWSSGRVVLVGDAAHPMLQYLAQGACQALEDAAALADALAKTAGTPHPAAGDVNRAFAEYQAARLEQAGRVQRTARAWGDIWHVEGLAMALRDEAFRLRAGDDYRHVDWLYAGERLRMSMAQA